MRNQERWTSSKYVYRNNRLIASRNPREVLVSSRLMSDIIASFYDNALKEHAKGKLLDLGCGKVPLYATYKERVSENVCVDWSNTLHKNEYLDHELDLTQTLPFNDNEFDTLVLSDVLEHIPAPEALWREMHRVLAKQGKLIMNVPFYYWLHEQPHDYYRYTEFALRRFTENSGMRLIQLSPMGGAPEIMADVFAKNVVRLPRVGRPLAMFAQWSTFRFVRSKMGQKVSRATGRNFPIGYFLIAEKV